MRPETKDFVVQLRITLAAPAKFFVFVRAREFQEEATETLTNELERAKALKLQAVANSSEEDANLLLALECLLEARIAELRLYLALKDDRISDAWTMLIAAQTSARSAMDAHALVDLRSLIMKLAALEENLFPQMLFASAGMIVKEARCSICNEDYESCDHIKGRAYWGELCTRNITSCEITEVSIVPDPANKDCRPQTTTDGDNVIRDIFTWRTTELHQHERS